MSRLYHQCMHELAYLAMPQLISDVGFINIMAAFDNLIILPSCCFYYDEKKKTQHREM